MHVHINHVFCTDSIWGGNYWCRYMVVIKRWLEGGDDSEDQDWLELLEEHPFFDQQSYDRIKEWYKSSGKHFEDASLRLVYEKTTHRLKPEVMKWLESNIEDAPKGQKGFTVGTDSYNGRCVEGFSLWFYRRSDALKFIKKWSKYEKPTTYFDYFRDIRKELDLSTRKLKIVDEFTLT